MASRPTKTIVKLRIVARSAVVTIPLYILKAAGLKVGDYVEVEAARHLVEVRKSK